MNDYGNARVQNPVPRRRSNRSALYSIASPVRWLLIPLAILGMGISMPSCPGQQAMQQQIDGVEKREGALAQRTQTLENQLRSLSSEMGGVKQQLANISGTIIEQKHAIEKLTEEVSRLKAAKPTKADSKSKASSKSSKGAGRGHKKSG